MGCVCREVMHQLADLALGSAKPELLTAGLGQLLKSKRLISQMEHDGKQANDAKSDQSDQELPFSHGQRLQFAGLNVARGSCVFNQSGQETPNSVTYPFVSTCDAARFLMYAIFEDGSRQ